MKFIIHTILYCFISTVLLGQTAQISGTVTDADNEPVTGALIRLEPTYKGDVSNAEGSYRLDGIANGSYTLSVSYLGYETDSV